MEIGKDNLLKIVRFTSVGAFLTDGEHEVLLPKKYTTREMQPEDEVEVFVYLDHEERPVATTLEPKIYRDEFALLKVNYINEFGAFLDMGLEKDLFVPFKEQARKMEVNKRYLIYMYLDPKSNRLVGSSKLNQFLNLTEPDVEVGQEVDLIVSHITEMGINVIINEKFKGLMYKNQVFEDLRTGDRIIGYIKEIRKDGKIDVSRTPINFTQKAGKLSQIILEILDENDGYLGLHDKSHPEEIKDILGMSKKAFKQTIGTLYKEKKIKITDKGIFKVKN